tara:strand:- start:837 stop:1103 length:267 start_codon:yes stop_codon:yes gene_type:complete
MEKIKGPIFFSTFFMVVYVIVTHLESVANISLIMFTLSPLVVLCLAYKILKDGTPSGETFTRKFYDDHNYIRVEARERDTPNASDLRK